MAVGLPLKIQVLDGPLASQSLVAGLPPGIVELSGWSAPFRPVRHGGTTMREKTTFYPGNPEGTQQVIGKTYKPTTFEGRWSDRYLGDGAAAALVEVFEAIVASGSTVRVTYSTTTGVSTVRIGLLTDFDPELDTGLDFGWTATFKWRGRGDAFAPAVAAAQILNPREGFQEAIGDLLQANSVALTLLDRLKSPIPQVARDAVAAATGRIDSATRAIQAVSSEVTEAANFPAGAARALVGAAVLGVQATTEMATAFLSIGPRRLLPPADYALDLLIAMDQLFSVLASTDAGGDSAARAADGVAQMDEPEVLAELSVPAGTDLRDLARRYYGDPDAWWAIADYNDLGTSEVPAQPASPADRPPIVIRIPRRQVGPQSDLRQNC